MEPIASHLAVGHHWKEAGTILFAPSLYVFTYMDKSFPEPKFPRLNPSSSISLSSQERCSTLFIIFMALQRTLSSMSMSLLLLGGQNWAQHSRVTSSYFRNGKDLLPWLAGNISPNMAQDTFSLCCKGTFVAQDSLASTRIPGCFLQNFFPKLSHGVVPLQVQSLSLLLSTSARFLSAHFSSLSGSLRMAAPPLEVSEDNLVPEE